MSYKHLAGRLIETQRSMLGEPAIEIARSTEGITVTDDGNVTAVDGDGRVVVDALARRYTDMLGGAAEDRLLAAAREFEAELALPPSLGGPEEFDAGHRDPAAHDPTGTGPATLDPADADSAEADVEDADSAEEDIEGPGSPGDDVESPDSRGDVAVTGSPSVESTGTASPRSGAVSDGGTVEVQAGRSTGTEGGATRVVSPTPTGPGEVVSPTPDDTDRDGTTTESYERAVDDAPTDDEPVVTLSEPVTVEYTVASTVTGGGAATDLSSVYLMPGDGSGFQAPVAVADAVADAVVSATALDREDLGEFEDDVDVERLLATLGGENGETVSFQLDIGDLTVTFHRSGSLAVH